ncbi:MAG: N-acetylneuraminate synthase family protein [Planctomycetota bacterium]
MKINGRTIGRESLPYIIAEIGVNHDGSVDQALRLIDAAAAAGADAVKTQCFDPDRLLSIEADLTSGQAAGGEHDVHTMLQRLTLDHADLNRCVEHAHRAGLHAIVSIFSAELVDEMSQLPWDAFKSASPDIINLPLLEAMWASGRPLLMSTGAADSEEIAAAFARFGDIAMHCVSAYPTPLDAAHLAGIRDLENLLSHLDQANIPPRRIEVGYSDHTHELITSALAVAAGATVLEKHLTLDRTAHGPDHTTSLDPAGFRTYVHNAHEAWQSLGTVAARGPDLQAPVRTLCRQSVAFRSDLPAGHRLEAADLTTRRPGTGIAPRFLSRLIGCTLRANVSGRHLLKASDLVDPPASVVTSASASPEQTIASSPHVAHLGESAPARSAG